MEPYSYYRHTLFFTVFNIMKLFVMFCVFNASLQFILILLIWTSCRGDFVRCFIQYSRLLHLPATFKFCFVGWFRDGIQDCETFALAVRPTNHSPNSHLHSARSHSHSARSHPHSARSYLHSATLQRQNAENLKQIFPEKEYRGFSPNFHIHASVSELYIPTMGLPFLLEEVCGPMLGIYKSLTDTWMWKLVLRPRNSQKRNT